mmetsp:Transcript_66679/g.175497  ORF Transcript_66679/g.175497 Transcript_66679/m.175497 type:complete len:86 (+) Transcript_66679:1363-1620(+)
MGRLSEEVIGSAVGANACSTAARAAAPNAVGQRQMPSSQAARICVVQILDVGHPPLNSPSRNLCLLIPMMVSSIAKDAGGYGTAR